MLPTPNAHLFSVVLLHRDDFPLQALPCVWTVRGADGEGAEDACFESRVGNVVLCTSCLCFEPENAAHPMVLVKHEHASDFAVAGETIVLTASKTTLVPSLHAPHTLVRRALVHTVRCAERKARRSVFLRRLPLVVRAFAPDQPAAERLPERESCLKLLRQQAGTDASQLRSNETVVALAFATRVHLLLNTHGTVVLTDASVHFQPLCLVGSEHPTSISLSDVEMIVPHSRPSPRHSLEFHLPNDVSLLLSFPTSSARAKILASLQAMPALRKASDLAAIAEEALRRWQARELSSYEYLLVLNKVGGRGFSDACAYPVMPWVICDYASPQLDLSDPRSYRDLSKPVGALNPERLDMFRRRMQHIRESEPSLPSFLYGSHFMALSNVIFYTVRKRPELMVQFAGGRLEIAERMFFSVANTWKGATTNSSDVKEVVPEFYNGDGSFLKCPEGMDLGAMDNGTRIHDVQLPPWAASPQDFVAKCREALESEITSANLHKWIDLVFGARQQGEGAEQADNVFHPMFFDSSSGESGEEELRLLGEFGQHPHQLLVHPHPARNDKPRLFGLQWRVPSVSSSSGGGDECCVM